MPSALRPPQHRISFFAIAAGLILLGWALRLMNTPALPLFIDEALHIARARLIATGDLYAGFEQSKWLYPAALSLFAPTGPEAIFIARAFSALCGAFTIGCCLALGDAVSGRRGALAAGLLYAVLPLAILHERQALVDGQLAALTTLATLLAWRVAARPYPVAVAALALVLAGAALTRLSALPVLALPLAALALRAAHDGWGQVRRAGPGLVLSIGLGWGVVAWVTAEAVRGGIVLEAARTASIANTALASLARPDTLAKVVSDGLTAIQIGWVYAGPAVLGLVLVALFHTATGQANGRRGRAVVYILIPALAFAAIPILVERPTAYLPPRYFVMNGPALCVLAAAGWAALRDRLTSLAWGRVVSAAALCLAAAQGLWLAGWLMADPVRAPLLAIDNRNLFYAESSGAGYSPAAAYLIDRWERDGQPVNVVVNAAAKEHLTAYLGPRIGESFRLRSGDPALSAALVRWLAADQAVYLVDHSRYPQRPTAHPYDLTLEPVEVFNEYGAQVTLYRVTAVGGERAAAVYAARLPAPDKLKQELAAVAASGSPATLIVFPGHAYAQMLADLTAVPVVPLDPLTWPPARGDIIRGLQPVDQEMPPGTPVDLVLIDEAMSDPARTVPLAVLAELPLYRTGETWHGYTHQVHLMAGPADRALMAGAGGAELEGGIMLTGSGFLPAPDLALIYMRLVWQTARPVADPYSVFVHLIGPDGSLLSQADAVPGGGLLPMTAWQPGVAVSDRFVLPLPPELVAGVEYTIRVGVYRPADGIRLPVIAGPGAGGDSVPLGALTLGLPSAQ